MTFKHLLISLRGLNITPLSDEERELLEYEIDACELYLHDTRYDAEENQICPQCGNILPVRTRFAPNVGQKLKVGRNNKNA